MEKSNSNIFQTIVVITAGITGVIGLITISINCFTLLFPISSPEIESFNINSFAKSPTYFLPNSKCTPTTTSKKRDEMLGYEKGQCLLNAIDFYSNNNSDNITVEKMRNTLNCYLVTYNAIDEIYEEAIKHNENIKKSLAKWEIENAKKNKIMFFFIGLPFCSLLIGLVVLFYILQEKNKELEKSRQDFRDAFITEISNLKAKQKATDFMKRLEKVEEQEET